MADPNTPYSLVTREQGTVYTWEEDTITIRLNGMQTQGLFTLTEDFLKPNFSLGLHLHRHHAETFYILEGEVEFRIGDDIRVMGVGTTLHVPPNVPHAVRVTNGQPARLLMIFAPAGFDEFLSCIKTMTDEQLADKQYMKQLEEKYDIINLE